MTADSDKFLERRAQLVVQLNQFELNDESRRKEFQAVIQRIIDEGDEGFYLMGDARYYLEPKGRRDEDWRWRDINRLLTRHREDRPIRDARRWAKLAIGLALIALASSFVSAIADFPQARENIVKWFGR